MTIKTCIKNDNKVINKTLIPDLKYALILTFKPRAVIANNKKYLLKIFKYSVIKIGKKL